LSSGEIAQGTIVSAVIGGTASRISGGKFANGAQTGAFQYLFNQVSSSLRQTEDALITDEEARTLAKHGIKAISVNGKLILKSSNGTLIGTLTKTGAGVLTSGLGFLDADIADSVLTAQTRRNIDIFQAENLSIEGLETSSSMTIMNRNGNHIGVAITLAEHGYQYRGIHELLGK
jgi:hypothetical protein